ncbi:putative DNA binding domain-containing protein, partial [Candidatus Bipolaricaulota bacterium]|nr:putative DNA binding domain-containing protein [Candidatus Bipolaricaulota bacterium]
LDGQQRLTTLYVLFEGVAPPFYEGEKLFFDLYFNMQTEEFRFWQESLMRGNPAWISVHEFLRRGLTNLLEGLEQTEPAQRELVQQNLSRLSRLDKVREYTYTVDQVSGDTFTLDEVVEIFNRVNSAGTPLTKADLALAHICSIWPEARAEMRGFQEAMGEYGFGVDLGFLVRCLAGIAVGSVLLESSFTKAPVEDLQAAWRKLKAAFEHLVNVLRHDAFVDDLGDLPTTYVLIPVIVYLARRDTCAFPSETVKKRFIRWLYLAGLWARYSGASETKLQQDVSLVTGRDLDPTPELEAAILRERGRIALEASDLEGAGVASAVAKFSYILARAREARDWFTGIRLYDKAVGKRNGLESHHIFPKGVLKRAGYLPRTHRKLINELANRAFLTQQANRRIKAQSPDKYLPEVEENQPGALKAQCVPLDRELWKPENYLDFLAARRQLLAKAMNDYIASLLPAPEAEPTDELAVRRRIAAGESETLEFKSSLRWDFANGGVNRKLEQVVLKSIAGFLNSKKGGTLIIGVNDQGEVVGLEHDYGTLRKSDRDGFALCLGDLINHYLGASVNAFFTVTFHEIDGRDVCQVSIEPSDHPVYVHDGGASTFYLRTGNATSPLPVDQVVKYVQHRWGGK